MGKYVDKEEKLTNLKINIGIFIIVLLASMPLMIQGLVSGFTDIYFHLWRIEAIKDGMQHCVFPVKIYAEYLNGKGYASGVFYPDLFLYFPAILRILGLSVVNAYKVFLIGMNVMTAVIAYRVAKYILKDYRMALLISLIWTTCDYRMEDIYNRAAIGEALALTFYPLLMGAMFILMYEIGQNYQRRSICWLVMGATGVIESHILSTEMIGIFLVLVCVFNFRYILKKQKIQALIISVVIIVGLNAGFLVPFLTYMITEKISVTSQGVQLIQVLGLEFKNILPFVDTEILHADGSIGYIQPKTLGYGLLITGFINVGSVFYNKKKNYIKRQCRLIVLTLLGLFLTSRYFPYNFLCTHSGMMNKLLGTIQFPWRWLGCVSIIIVFSFMFFLLDGENYSRTSKRVITVTVLAISLLTVLDKSCGIITEAKENECISYFETAEDLPQESIYQIMTGEYVPTDAKINDQYSAVKECRISASVLEYQRKDNMYLVLVEATKNEEISIPILYYSNYHAYNDEGEELRVTCGEDGHLKIHMTSAYKGRISIRYIEPWYWRVAEVFSVVTLIILCIGSGVWKKR